MTDKRPDYGPDYDELTQTLAAGPIQPWQRDASFPELPEVGRSACLGCMGRKLKRELRGLKPYPHTCLLKEAH